MRPINVLDLRDTYEIGGPGKTILETFRAIDTTRFKLHLGVFQTRREEESTPFIEAARSCDMPVHVIRGFNQYDARVIARTADLVCRLGIQIVHAHEAKSDVIAYLCSVLQPVRTITTLHGWIGNTAKQRMLACLDRHVIGRFDRVIVVSRQIREHVLAAGVGAAKIRLVHNAIVLDRYRRTGARGFISELVGRDVSGPVISTIGRLSAEKGQADLLEALAMVKARGRRFTAVFAGDGPDRRRLVQQIRALRLEGDVHLPGYVSEPQRVLEESDLMVLPSHSEGLPNAALEAMAMEVPVLATQVGGTPEVITDCRTGRLVPSHSPQRLADAIEEFLLDPHPWRQMAAHGRIVVERDFDFRARTRRVEAIYAELIEAAG